jgi:hypothetical protein
VAILLGIYTYFGIAFATYYVRDWEDVLSVYKSSCSFPVLLFSSISGGILQSGIRLKTKSEMELFIAGIVILLGSAYFLTLLIIIPE